MEIKIQSRQCSKCGQIFYNKYMYKMHQEIVHDKFMQQQIALIQKPKYEIIIPKEIIISEETKKVKKFNQELIRNGREILMNEYMIMLNEEIYQIDLSFLETFMQVIEITQPCIPYQLLQQFNILQFKTSNDFKRILKKNNFEEDIDFTNRKLAVRGIIGQTFKNEYIISPKCFKAILMKCTNNNKFIKYYQFLEDCIYYFSDYQLQEKNYQLLMKDKKMDILIIQNNKILEQNEKQMSKINNLNQKLDQQNDRLDEQNELLIDQREQNQQMFEMLDQTTDQYVVNTLIQDKQEQLVIIRIQNNRYRFIKGQQMHIRQQLRNIIGQNIYQIDTPNASNFGSRIRQQLGRDQRLLQFNGNNFQIINNLITEVQLLEMINEIEQQKKEIIIDLQVLQEE